MRLHTLSGDRTTASAPKWYQETRTEQIRSPLQATITFLIFYSWSTKRMNFRVMLTRPQKQPKNPSPDLSFAANKPDPTAKSHVRARGFLRANYNKGEGANQSVDQL